MDEFSVIYADPPWRYAASTPDPKDSIETKYPTMAVEDICAMKVPAAKDAVLYLWATAPLLPEAFQVMAAWGFKYKSHAIWDKCTPGLGYWFRVQHELLLVGTRGKFSPPKPPDRISSVLRVKRGAHSSKPDQVRDLIKGWFPNERRLELFARQWTSFWPVPEGWEVHGNQTDSTVDV